MALLPLIGGAISAISGLFGGSKEKVTRNEVDYVKLRKSAEKAGFNPLTALRNGGSAGFAVTHHPALSFGERLGNAASTFGGFLMNYDWNAQKRADQEGKLLEAQLGLIQAETERARSFSFNVPQAQASTRVQKAGGSSNAGWSGVIMPMSPEPGKVTQTHPFQAGVIHGGMNDAEMIETRYGDSEVLQTLTAPFLIGADIYANLKQWKADGYPGGVKVRKQTPKEAEESGFWPSFSIRWD